MKIMGISGTSLYDVKHYIEEFKSSLDDKKKKKLVLQFLGFGQEPKENAFVLLIPSMGAFKQVYKKIPNSCRVIVFDSPIILQNSGIPLADSTTKDNVSYQMHALDYSTFELQFKKLLNGEYTANPDTDFKLIPHLLQEVKGSLTQTLLNITMQCRVPEKRRQITYMFLIWLLSGKPIGDLQEKLAQYNVDQEAIKQMVDWLETDFGKEARKVFLEIRNKQRQGKTVNYDSICKGTSVQPFDVKYLLRHVRQLGAVIYLDSTSYQEYQKRKDQNKEQPQEQINIMDMTLDEYMAYMKNNGDE